MNRRLRVFSVGLLLLLAGICWAACQVNVTETPVVRPSPIALEPSSTPTPTPTPTPEPIRFYVAPGGNDVWTGKLAEVGAADGPFKTLERARDAIRAAILLRGMQADAEVIVRGGDYYLSKPLLFDEHDSGQNGFDVIYKAASGETPILHGGNLITGWKVFTENVYVADVDPGTKFYTLYENGLRASEARFPNEGYLRTRPTTGEAQHQFEFSPGELPVLDSTNGLKIYVWPGGGELNWETEVIPVASIDYPKSLVTLTDNAIYPVNNGGSRYFLEDSLALLDSPGEFYLDSINGKLYYWPRHQPIEDQQIIAPSVTRLVGFVGSAPSTPVQNMRLQGLTLMGTDFLEKFTRPWYFAHLNGSIAVSNAAHIEIQDCHIFDGGLTGIYISGSADGITVRGNLIHNVGFNGIWLNGPSSDSPYFNQNNTIVNNYIHHTGELVGQGAGIVLENSNDNRVSYNLIHDTPRYSISQKGSPAASLIGRTLNGVEVTRANVNDYLKIFGNVISYNDLSQANQDSQDTGVIEAYGLGRPGNRIENNLIHDSNINLSFGFGIYMDDGSDGVIIQNNLIQNLQNANGGRLEGALMIKGVGTQVINNFVVNNNISGGVFQSLEGGYANRNLYSTHNIFYNNQISVIYDFWNWSKDRMAVSDFNVFYNSGGTPPLFSFRGSSEADNLPTTLDEWRLFMNDKFDQHSLAGDPLFMDPANDDFRLHYNSPAYTLGINNIDVSLIGLQANFPYADPHEPLSRLFIHADQQAYGAVVSLRVDGTAHLNVSGRTMTGYVADLSEMLVQYTVDNPQIARVNNSGTVQAIAPGIARVTAIIFQPATASRAEVRKSVALDIVVGPG
jgi:parallel beta-helix repeat protein